MLLLIELQDSQWNHQWTANSNVLVINAFLTIDYLLFYRQNHGRNEKSRGVFEIFSAK